MRVIYICHPIAGDMENNLSEIHAIIRQMNLNENLIPFAPYLADIGAMDDRIPEERKKGIENTLAIIERTKIDELRVFGDNISKGMMAEIKAAIVKGIPLKFMSTIARVRFAESLGID